MRSPGLAPASIFRECPDTHIAVVDLGDSRGGHEVARAVKLGVGNSDGESGGVSGNIRYGEFAVISKQVGRLVVAISSGEAVRSAPYGQDLGNAFRYGNGRPTRPVEQAKLHLSVRRCANDSELAFTARSGRQCGSAVSVSVGMSPLSYTGTASSGEGAPIFFRPLSGAGRGRQLGEQ